MRAVVQKQSPKLEAAQASARRAGAARPTRDARAGVRGEGEAPEVVREVLGSEGEQLDESARLFMESRFGRDFSRVRVHTDAKAAESARALGALAYASGERIVFAAGRYRPASHEGRRLLAHELAHTLQRPADGRVRRKIDFTQPATPALSDPIPLVLNGRTILGQTRPTVNGAVPGRGEKADYQTAIFKALQPLNYNFTGKEGALNCNVNPEKYHVGISALLSAVTEPPDKKKWAGAYEVARMKNPPEACKNRELGAVRVEMRGKPDSEALFNKVQTHEGEHATDLKNLTASVLKPYNDFLLGLKGAGKDERACVDNIFAQVGGKDGKDTKAVQSFVDKWQAAVNVYDKPTGTHHSKFKTTSNPRCDKLTVQEV